MNPGQADAFKAAMEGHSFLLTGAAGTGMCYLLFFLRRSQSQFCENTKIKIFFKFFRIYLLGKINNYT